MGVEVAGYSGIGAAAAKEKYRFRIHLLIVVKTQNIPIGVELHHLAGKAIPNIKKPVFHENPVFPKLSKAAGFLEIELILHLSITYAEKDLLLQFSQQRIPARSQCPREQKDHQGQDRGVVVFS